MIAFDFDGTLVETFGSTLLHNVAARLALLDGPLVVLTNQAGPLYRIATQDPKYPAMSEVAARLIAFFDQLGCEPALLLVACAPPDIAALCAAEERRAGEAAARLMSVDRWWERAAYIAGDISAHLMDRYGSQRAGASADAVWRKPSPGMLQLAARHFNIDVARLTYVGDMASDGQAAKAAGAGFVSAKDYFGWEGAALEQGKVSGN